MFMKPEIVVGKYVAVDTQEGIFYFPAGDSVTPDSVRDYVESQSDPSSWEISIETGILGRLSAHGYMDCTEWTPYGSKEEAMEDGEG